MTPGPSGPTFAILWPFVDAFRRRRQVFGSAAAFLAALFTAPWSVFAGVGRWTSNGPPAGMQSLTADPVTYGTVYAGTDKGLYRSADYGQTWQLLASSFGADSQVTALAVDPTNPAALYAGNGRSGLFKSTDGGATFSASNVGLPAFELVTRIAIARSEPSTIYLVGQGIYRSTNAGASWSRTSLFRNAYSLAVDPRNSRRVVAGSDWGRASEQDVFAGIFLTDDGGDTWRLAPVQPSPGDVVTDLQIDPLNPDKAYATIYSVDRISRTTDGGQTWFKSSNGYTGYGPTAVAIDPRNPNFLYVTSHDPPTVMGAPPPDVFGVYRSINGGLNWIRFNEGGSPGEDLLAIDATGRFVYSASFLNRGVFVIEVATAPLNVPSLDEMGKLALVLALASAATLLLKRAR